MKRTIAKLSESEIRRSFPMTGKTKGWFFRGDEVSAGVFVVEGTDLWGRTVSRTGFDPDQLLAACDEDARTIADQVAGTTSP